LDGIEGDVWEAYTRKLKISHVRIKNIEVELVWSNNGAESNIIGGTIFLKITIMEKATSKKENDNGEHLCILKPISGLLPASHSR